MNSRFVRKRYLKLVRVVNTDISAKPIYLCARAADGVVRGQPRGLSVRARPNTRLLAMIADELTAARATAEKTDQPARRFKDFQWSFKMNAFWAPENFEPSSFFAPPGRGNREKL